MGSLFLASVLHGDLAGLVTGQVLPLPIWRVTSFGPFFSLLFSLQLCVIADA